MDRQSKIGNVGWRETSADIQYFDSSFLHNKVNMSV